MLYKTVRLVALIKGDPTPFAVMYTSGNLISMCATMFLYGPWTQVKQMLAPTRFIATCVYFGLMFVTLFLAYFPEHIPGRLLLIVCAVFMQFLSLCWYTLSYIPFARDLVSNCLKNSCLGSVCPCGCDIEAAMGGGSSGSNSSSYSMFSG